eukprot:1261078-Rhodomonas_salina.1
MMTVTSKFCSPASLMLKVLSSGPGYRRSRLPPSHALVYRRVGLTVTPVTRAVTEPPSQPPCRSNSELQVLDRLGLGSESSCSDSESDQLEDDHRITQADDRDQATFQPESRFTCRWCSALSSCAFQSPACHTRHTLNFIMNG